MSDSSDCELPSGMARSAFEELCRPLKQARSTLSKARSKGLRTVAKNAQKVKAAKAKVKEFCREWLRERDRRQEIVVAMEAGNQGLNEKLDRVLSLLTPRGAAASTAAASTAAASTAAASTAAASTAAASQICAICQEDVSDGGFELSCCKQRLHKGCLIPYSCSDSAAACPFCRRAWSAPLKQKISEMCDEAWRRSVISCRDPILLDPDGGDYHTRLSGRAELRDGRLVVDDRSYGLCDLSFENDAIHSFVRRFLGGRWPRLHGTVLRITANTGERLALRFCRFENRFWAEPVVVLEYDLEELEDETVVVPLSSVTSAVAVNPWRAEDAPVLGGHGLGLNKLWITLLRGAAPLPITVRLLEVGDDDDLVEPVLRFADPFSYERRSVRVSAIQFFVGPITLARPSTEAYDRLTLLAAEHVVKLTVYRGSSRDLVDYVVRVIGFQGDRVHAVCQSPYCGYLALEARDVLLARPP